MNRYDETAPVILSRTKLDFIGENYPNLRGYLPFIETAKNLAREYNEANDWPPYTSDSSRFPAAYFVTENDIHRAAKIFMSVEETTDFEFQADSNDTREIERMPYAGGFTGGYESDAPESMDLDR